MDRISCFETHMFPGPPGTGYVFQMIGGNTFPFSDFLSMIQTKSGWVMVLVESEKFPYWGYRERWLRSSVPIPYYTMILPRIGEKIYIPLEFCRGLGPLKLPEIHKES